LYARNRRLSHGQMIEQTQSKVVITDHTFIDDVRDLDRDIETLHHIVDRGEDYEQWLRAQSAADPMVEVSSDDWYIIRHSAGTTGRPKGVGYTQHDWLVNCRNWYYRLPNLEVESVVGHAGPISHASGYLFLPAWLHGSTNLLFGAFDAAKVLDMMQRHRVTHAFAPPSMLAALAVHPKSNTGDWTALQCLLIGGAPSTNATILAGRRAFGDVLYQVFGQTEAVPLTIMTPSEWFAETPGSTPLRAAGRPLPFAQIEIRDAAGAAVPLGDIGEIYAKVESQLRGFWNDDAATSDRLVDGWIRTRDIGRIDTNGYLYVLDRADDMIVSGGFNIWPAELETVIADHPEVIEVAVFAIPHERWGETPMAVCYVEDGAKVSSEDIMQLVADALGSYKKPSRVDFIGGPLPKSPVGKLMRKTLRDPHWADHARRVGGG